MPCLEHRVSVGRRVHGRSEDRVSQHRFQRLSQGGSLVPEGTEVSPEGRHAGGLCEPGWKLTAVRTVSARRSGHSVSQLGNRETTLSWKRGELRPGGLARAVRPKSTADRGLEATSATTDQVALEARGLLQRVGYPEIVRAETAPGWTTWERCLSKSAGPEAGRFYSRGSHEGTEITVRFRRSRRSTPSDYSDGLRAHHATLARAGARLSRIPTSWGSQVLRRGPGLPLSPKRHARPKASDPQAGQLRPQDWTCRSRSQVLTGVSGAHRSERVSTGVDCGSTRSADWPVG
jgi:hypothetical protein